MLYAAAQQDLLKDVHLLVGTPEHLARVATSGNLRLHQLQAPPGEEAAELGRDTVMDCRLLVAGARH